MRVEDEGASERGSSACIRDVVQDKDNRESLSDRERELEEEGMKQGHGLGAGGRLDGGGAQA